MKRKGKIRWGTLLNAILGTVAIAADPAVLDLAGKVGIPHQVTAGIALVSLGVATYKKSVVRAEHERSPR